MGLSIIVVVLAAAATALAQDSASLIDVFIAATASDQATTVSLRGGAGSKLPAASRVVHRWHPAACERHKLGQACPLEVATFADGHAAVTLLGVKLPQLLGNAVARAVRRALPKAAAGDLTLPRVGSSSYEDARHFQCMELVLQGRSCVWYRDTKECKCEPAT